MIMPISEKIFNVFPEIQRLRERSCQGKRHRQHNDERIDKTFKLCRQDQVNQDQGKYKRKRSIGAAFSIVS